jgi:uncharacterized protein
MPAKIIISGKEIKKGENKQINLNIARLPTRTIIDIPIFVRRAKKDGPVLLLLAGMHGDEVNGVEIIRRMISKNLITPQKGTVIAIPLFNIYGFLNFSRQVPDGKDVNRSFPGNSKGSLASRVAYHFMKEVFPWIDYGIDFHTGGGNIFNYPQIRCTFDKKLNLELGKAFAPPFLINAKLRDKSLRKTAYKAGKSIIVYEAGESQRLSAQAVNEGVKGALRLMHHFGMTDKYETPRETIVIKETTWIRARISGMYRSFLVNGVPVRKNEVVGSITDPYGEHEEGILSPVDGHVIAINNQPVVNQGDALMHIGVE